MFDDGVYSSRSNDAVLENAERPGIRLRHPPR